jgi:hypothetical protein
MEMAASGQKRSNGNRLRHSLASSRISISHKSSNCNPKASPAQGNRVKNHVTNAL